MLTDKDLEELRQERRADYLAEAAREAASQALEARDSDSHGRLQAKTAILTLPQGSGKTLLGHALAARLGCARVVDDWSEGQALLQGALHLTHSPVSEVCA